MPPSEYPAPADSQAMPADGDIPRRRHLWPAAPASTKTRPVDPGDRLTGSNAMTSQPRLLTVNIVHRIHPGYFHDTAIDKQPVDGPVELTPPVWSATAGSTPTTAAPTRRSTPTPPQTPTGGPPSSAEPSPRTVQENLRTQDLDVSGDPITIVDRPHHGVRVCDLATGPHATEMRRLLDSGIPLATTVRAKAHRVARRSTLDQSAQHPPATPTHESRSTAL